VNPQLNDEQLQAHWRDFCEFWNKEVLPDINAEIMEGNIISAFQAGRMFENLWLERKAKIEMDYWEAIGLFDDL